MGIKIVTDSTSDIDNKRQEELGIEILPLTVSFGDTDYIDGVTITNEEFYERLRTCEKLPVTTQINPERFVAVYEKYKKSGDVVIVILLSSKLSGTYQSALIAKTLCGSEHVFVVDSKAVTLALASIVFEAIKMRDEGLEAPELYEKLLTITEEFKFYAMVDTLKYLKMGGRLSAASAAVGSLLNIKPIITFKDGEIVVAAKTRGKKAAYEFMLSKLKEEKPDLNRTFIFGSSDNLPLREEFISYIKENNELSAYEQVNLGSVVGTHGGPNCVGLCYYGK